MHWISPKPIAIGPPGFIVSPKRAVQCASHDQAGKRFLVNFLITSQERDTATSPRISRWCTSLAWALVLFYVLASVRALIPGLCATQVAMDNQCPVERGAPQLIGNTIRCCTSPAARTTPEDGEKRPITPAESHCAFCNLIIGLTDPPEPFILPVPTSPQYAERIPLTVQRAQEIPWGVAPNRGPPA